MAFREVHVIEAREVLRLWLHGYSLRRIAQAGVVDRKTARRYVTAAEELGLKPGVGNEVLTDEVLGQVLDRVRPAGPGVHGASWEFCQKHRGFLLERVDLGLRLTKVQKLLLRHTGVSVPYRTLHRYAREELGFRKEKTTVRVADGEPGKELQVDFGRLGRVNWNGAVRELHALILTASYSRHMFVWPTHRQTLDAILEGLEEAWRFFGGVFPVLIPDNTRALVAQADACDSKLTVGFMEYCQHLGIVVDPTRVRHPKDKPRVERAVPYVREDFFKGETFIDLADARRRAEEWCRKDAGLRTHGTTKRTPLGVFEAEEKPLLQAVPDEPYDMPSWVETTVRLDQHASVLSALYSLPIDFVREEVEARADHKLVRFYLNGRLIKTHPRKQPGERSTDPSDYPAVVREYAMRDTASLQDRAAGHGERIGEYARRLLEGPLPWTRMRLCYRLLGLVQTYGPQRVEEACRRALDLDVVDVTRVSRMLAKALENHPDSPIPLSRAAVVHLRFERPSEDFAAVRNNPDKNGGSNG
jgi:transposase